MLESDPEWARVVELEQLKSGTPAVKGSSKESDKSLQNATLSL